MSAPRFYESQGLLMTELTSGQVETRIRPGAPLHIFSIALPHHLPFHASTLVYRSVVNVTSVNLLTGERCGPATLAALVPEKIETVSPGFEMYPETEYIFQVIGNALMRVVMTSPVHISAQFLKSTATGTIEKTIVRPFIALKRERQAIGRSGGLPGGKTDPHTWAFKVNV
ncbi:hypothetical protein BJ165DRAFT_1406978 [Panaeolus papilionaceus]|nr:hypothetical protein BJ165DRAFT_1406978 [Panaeolus papilionaceus]